MKATLRLTGLVLAGLFLALHLPFLPASLEDLDSINFALGIRDFDVSRHQPHPPGYPLFIAAAKALHGIGLSEVRALSLISITAGALAIVALMSLFGTLDEDRPDGTLTWMAVALVGVNPLYWLTAARPLSDLAGLAAALGVQALLVRVRTVRMLTLAAGVSAFAVGIRSQVLWLTFPLLLLSLFRLPQRDRWRGAFSATIAYGVGALLWVVPLVVVSGGPQAYWRALSSQGAEDLSGVTMLATTPTLRELVKAVRYAFVVPWASSPVAALVLMLAALGLLQLARQKRSTLAILIAAFGPYLVFDLLFQETITTRYALPLVVPVVYLAARGLTLLSPTPAALCAFALVALSAFLDDGLLYAYARSEAPAFRMLGDMAAAAPAADSARPLVLAMHRREEFDMRRPLQWVAESLPAFRLRLPATAKHEWLELVKYWNGGGADPVWFVADPLRSDLALVKGRERTVPYRWPLTSTSKELLGGARPNEVDLHWIESPEWYLGEGWSLTPETAGLAREDGRGPGDGGITGWIRRWSGPGSLMIGGRNLSPAGAPAQVRVAIDGIPLEDFTVTPGFFLRTLTVPSLSGAGPYGTIRIDADNNQLAIEQFDAAPVERVIFGFGEGWHEQEYNPSTGELWRWTSDRAVLRVRAGGHAIALTLRGEVEASSSSHVVIKAGERVVAEFEAGRTFARTVLIPADAVSGEESALTITSSAVYVPAEGWGRSQDRRRLGLKLYECRVTQAS